MEYYKLQFGKGKEDVCRFSGIASEQIQLRLLTPQEWIGFFRSQCYALYKEHGGEFDTQRVPNPDKPHYAMETPRGCFYVPQSQKAIVEKVLSMSQTVSLVIQAGYGTAKIAQIAIEEPS